MSEDLLTPLSWRKRWHESDARIDIVPAALARVAAPHLVEPPIPPRRRLGTPGYKRRAHQPPNQTPIPWTTPIGKNEAPAISKRRSPLDAQNTMDVSHAE